MSPNSDYRIVIRESGRHLAEHAVFARSVTERLVGLIGREGLPEGHALIIQPCKGVHTWGMRFSIDVCFVDRGRTVLAIYEELAPFRATPVVAAADAAIECPAGVYQRAGLRVGDRLSIEMGA